MGGRGDVDSEKDKRCCDVCTTCVNKIDSTRRIYRMCYKDIKNYFSLSFPVPTVSSLFIIHCSTHFLMNIGLRQTCTGCKDSISSGEVVEFGEYMFHLKWYDRDTNEFDRTRQP